jgi:hypothetical protein
MKIIGNMLKQKNGKVFKILFWGSPILILGGLITLLLSECFLEENCWWFTTKKK